MECELPKSTGVEPRSGEKRAMVRKWSDAEVLPLKKRIVNCRKIEGEVCWRAMAWKRGGRDRDLGGRKRTIYHGGGRSWTQEASHRFVLVGKRARPSASEAVDLFRDRCERVRGSRESRTRGRLWMSRVISERGLNAAAELWVESYGEATSPASRSRVHRRVRERQSLPGTPKEATTAGLPWPTGKSEQTMTHKFEGLPERNRELSCNLLWWWWWGVRVTGISRAEEVGDELQEPILAGASGRQNTGARHAQIAHTCLSDRPPSRRAKSPSAGRSSPARHLEVLSDSESQHFDEERRCSHDGRQMRRTEESSLSRVKTPALDRSQMASSWFWHSCEIPFPFHTFKQLRKKPSTRTPCHRSLDFRYGKWACF